MKRTESARGFALYHFKDRYNQRCSIQKSSIGTEHCIWLGTDDADPKILIPGKGWTPYPFLEDVLFSTRMHLSQKQVKKLLPILERFVKTGEI